MNSRILFNLSPFSASIFFPSAYLVECDANGQLGYPIQRATAATIVPYGHELSPALERLFNLIEQLTPKNLEAKFKAPKAKSPTPLAKLLADADTKPIVEKFIFHKIDDFLQEIVRDQWPLTFDLERKTHASDVQIATNTEMLVPHIAFNKTSDGVEYRFQLGTEDQKWPIQSRNVTPLTNTDPAWLLIDYALFRVPGINGNMVKPFQNKDVVHIPLDKAKVYFKQFVVKNAGRTRIEATGFAIFSSSELLRTQLRPVENILENAWYLQAIFAYPGIEFSQGEKRDRVTTVDFSQNETEEVMIRQVIRNAAAEKQQLGFLQNLGLIPAGNSYKIPGNNNLEILVEWLTKHKAALETAGLSIDAPLVAEKTIALFSGRLAIQTKSGPDWFDVFGQVEIGPHQFSFKAFWQHLRKKDRYFLLPDGSYFLIPETWFARYGELAEAAKDGPDDTLKLPKALFTLMEQAGLGRPQEGVKPGASDPEQLDIPVSPDLKATLRPYQLSGVKWLISHYEAGFGACLADDMGLGKTLQTIALLLHAKTARLQDSRGLNSPAVAQLDLFQNYQADLQPLNALIILPASLVFNWQLELQRFAPSLFVCAHTGPKRGKDARALAGYDVVLTTYHTARQDLDLLQKLHWHVMVLDESQQIKNRASEVSKVVHSLEAAHKISLSGTPIENSLSDLWSQMEFINPETLGSFKYFKEKFIQPIEKRNDPTAREQLFSRVRPFFLRRTKEEVAPDLPPLTEQLFFTEMSSAQQKLYDKTKSAARNEILALFDDPKTRFQALQALTRLRQIANDPRLLDAGYTGGSGKFDDVLAQWDTVRRAGHKVLFFSSFEKHLQLFRAIFEAEGYAYAWLTGDTAMKDRAREVSRFQEDPSVQAFFMTVKAGGVGLNLTAADYVFILDPWWNPAAEDQAIARAHRIGQARPVTALRFLAKDTIEEKIRQLQEKKKALGAALFESEEAIGLSREELAALLD